MKEQMNLGGGVFRNFSNSRLSYMICFKELIDNSLDQNAKNINIIIKKKGEKTSLTIEDDGGGCDNLKQMVSPGVHCKTDTTLAGMYGLGFTAAACWITQLRSVMIRTVKAGMERSAMVNYLLIEQTGDPTFDSEQRYSTDSTGMKIHFPHCGKQLSDIQKYCDELSFLYAIRLSEGVRICVVHNEEKKLLKPNMGPKLRGIVNFSGDLDGKPFSGWCGITEEGERTAHHGMNIFWGHRLMTTTRDCCGDANTSRIFGILKIGLDFEPNPMKDGLADEDEWNDLMEKVHGHILNVLQQADAEAEDFEWSSICSDVEANMNEVVKGRRSGPKGDRKPPGKPTGNGSPHRNFSNSQPGGNEIGHASSWRIKVHHVDGNKIICRHDLAHGKKGDVLHVYIDKTHPWFADCEDPGRKRGRVESVVADQVAIAAAEDEDRECPMFKNLHKETGDVEDNAIAVYRTNVMKFSRGFATV